MNKIKKDNSFIFYNDKESIRYFDEINKNNYKILNILKDDRRSYVVLIEIFGEKLVYKIPREKNNRKWQRFLSIFRGSQSKREFLEIEKVSNLGFNTGKPILAAEKKKTLWVIDSYFLYTYVEGYQSTWKDAQKVSDILNEIHKLGYLHGDSQLENFIISPKEGKVYLIDIRFIKNIYGKFGQAYEFIYLEESCHNDEISLYDKNSIYYKGAMVLKNLMDFKRKLRNKE